MNKNPVYQAIYKSVFGDPSLDSKEEVTANLKIVTDAINTNVIDTVVHLSAYGPTESGSHPSSLEREWLMDNDYCAHVVIGDADGFYALTKKGQYLYRCQRQLYSRFNQGLTA